MARRVEQFPDEEHLEAPRSNHHGHLHQGPAHDVAVVGHEEVPVVGSARLAVTQILLGYLNLVVHQAEAVL